MKILKTSIFIVIALVLAFCFALALACGDDDDDDVNDADDFAPSFCHVRQTCDLALELAAETLMGMREPLGRLPVTLPGLFEAGHSAYMN